MSIILTQTVAQGQDSLLKEIPAARLVVRKAGREGHVVENETVDDRVLDGTLFRVVEAVMGERREKVSRG